MEGSKLDCCFENLCIFLKGKQQASWLLSILIKNGLFRSADDANVFLVNNFQDPLQVHTFTAFFFSYAALVVIHQRILHSLL